MNAVISVGVTTCLCCSSLFYLRALFCTFCSVPQYHFEPQALTTRPCLYLSIPRHFSFCRLDGKGLGHGSVRAPCRSRWHHRRPLAARSRCLELRIRLKDEELCITSIFPAFQPGQRSTRTTHMRSKHSKDTGKATAISGMERNSQGSVLALFSWSSV